MPVRQKMQIDFEFEPVLDPKVRRLIQAGSAVAAGCPTCLRNAFAGAKDAGATAAEIREALSVGIMVSAGRARNFSLDFLDEVGLK
jgi:AhpD family alkylhydroperoxidase